MSGRKLLVAFRAMILAIGLAAPVAGARKCGPGLCKDAIRACMNSMGCKRMRMKNRAQCRKACRTSIIAACTTDIRVCTGGSPGGAFTGEGGDQ